MVLAESGRFGSWTTMESCCFDRFVLNPAEGKLFADGVRVSLGSTDFRLLLALVENAGAIVSKNDLMSRVWGRATVEDNVLYVHINALRKVLGDDCIESHQRCGYRFAAPVRRVRPGAFHPHS